jgi:hypothetical protein
MLASGSWCYGPQGCLPAELAGTSLDAAGPGPGAQACHALAADVPREVPPTWVKFEKKTRPTDLPTGSEGTAWWLEEQCLCCWPLFQGSPVVARPPRRGLVPLSSIASHFRGLRRLRLLHNSKPSGDIAELSPRCPRPSESVGPRLCVVSCGRWGRSDETDVVH